MLRTHTCGELNEGHEGGEAALCGWVWKGRDLGGVLFLDLRDRFGFTQLVFDPKVDKDLHAAASKLKGEDVVRVAGDVRLRPEGTRRDDAPTGAVELHVRELEVLARAQTPPFNLAEEELEVNEDLRLEYRYLDLRRARMQRNLEVRHRAVKAIRDYLSARGFLEVETPILMKSTPEGARDYLVPSRVHRGKFYALPQSPQMYKQLLMAAGVDRYFQIPRCFRDEDQRADRQPEFTQLDVEMSFADEEDVFEVTEGVFAASFREGIGVEIKLPWPRLTWREALSRYGSDKPDVRFGLELVDVTEAFTAGGVFIGPGHNYKDPAALAIRVPGGLSNKDIKELERLAIKEYNIPGLAVFKVGENGAVTGAVVKFFQNENVLKRLVTELNVVPGDVLLAAAGEFPKIAPAMGAVRLKLAELLKVERAPGFHFLWVTDFPLFEADEKTGAPAPSHHPFTSPRPEDADKLETEPLAVMSRAYDIVVNGVELGSGSVRIHDAELQRRVFRALGYADEDIEERFGFFLRALAYGTPPHAGIAPGLDRWIMVMCGEGSIREVIAFPKTLRASSPMDGSPSAVAPQQLDELGLELKDDDKGK
jgi:aspartyl-tRNA synthetase